MEVPGSDVSPIFKVPSLNSGRNERPIPGISAILPTKRIRTPTSTALRHLKQNSKIGVYLVSRKRVSRLFFCGLLPVSTSSQALMAGVKISATSSDATIVVTYATPSGIRRRPSRPVRNRNGRNTTTMVKLASTIGPLISDDALLTISKNAFLSASDLPLFSCRRRKTFSTNTMASSTSTPIAIAIPPSVMVLNV